METTTLQIVWFFLIGVLLIGYAVLDGFDLGVGFWHLFSRKPEHRQVMIESIAPFWDGNEVWLLGGGGAVLAAFPEAYATTFSGFYLALMLVIFSLAARAVSIEFRNQVNDPRWHKTWDIHFAVGSILPAILFGVAVGNILRGMPLNADGNFTGTFFSLLNPYALLLGITSLAMCATHGALFLAVKTDGELREQAAAWTLRAWAVFMALFIAATIVTTIFYPHLQTNFKHYPLLLLVPLLVLASLIAIPIFIKRKQYLKAFIADAVAVAMIVATWGLSLFPNLVPALNDPGLSITIANGSSTERTLGTMLVLVLALMPLILLYTIFIYRKFRGTVRLGESGY